MPIPEPGPDERTLLSVYQQAEGHLLRTSTSAYGRAVLGPEGDELARREAGARTVAAATQLLVDQLDGIVPDLLGRIIGAAVERGEAAAVAQLASAGRGPGMDGDAYTDRGANRGALDRLAVALVARVTQAHAAILRTVPDAFRGAMGQVLPGLLVGDDTRRQTAQRAWWDLTDRGLTKFTDAGGRNWRLSSYVEMASRTASARATIDAQHDRLAALGHDLVMVQGSGDRCKACRPWHGKILTTGGGGRGTVRVEHATRDGEYVEVQVAGSVDDARRAGWGHPQCRCSTGVYLPGVTKVPALPKDDGQYEARQRQRALERQIRAGKERESTALTPTAAAAARDQTKAAQARMREHLADNPDLLRRPYREAPGAGNIGPRRDGATPTDLPTPTPRPVAPAAAEAERPAELELERRAATVTPDELADDYRRQLPELPADERRALHGYTGGDYNAVNSWLRGNDLVPGRDSSSPLAYVRDQADDLQRLSARYATPGPVQVRRYVNNDALPDVLHPGAEWTDKGFGSSTLGDNPPAGFRASPSVMVVDLPAGSRGIVVNAHRRGVDAESEFVLPPGTRYTVTRADEVDADGRRVVRVTAKTRTEDELTPARRAERLTDDELDDEMQRALEREDLDRFAELGDESDRREAKAAARAGRNAAARERRAAQRSAAEEQQGAEFERLLDEGVDHEEAVEQAYGIPVVKQRRDAAKARLNANGYDGTFAQASRAAYRDRLREQYIEAENATNGYMLNRAAEGRSLDPRKLFEGSEAFARKHASDELREHWDATGGRPSYDRYVDEELLGDQPAGGGEDFLR